ncbi:hypothetical protein M405DRAFT_808584 [Rhizopogon salebrosus TDB-379]|nr:hypothetical protein M405DRAFT_808584 [Rhizopogon salebrosus TDB-379]
MNQWRCNCTIRQMRDGHEYKAPKVLKASPPKCVKTIDNSGNSPQRMKRQQRVLGTHWHRNS